ncbi:transposase [Thiospirillum jenense]|uniref:Transposase n=2 Tax=Thiospirillum jenense TaxID=1653858 RepID=A0A839HHP8_9GAMM|nr:transposase [Thiospirillum jenense]
MSFTSSRIECTDLEITKSKLIKLSPTRNQKKIIKYWMTVSRYVFNWTIDFIRSCQNWTPNWMEIKKYATQLLPNWTKECPFQIKAIAIKDATTAFFKAKGKPQFRSRKSPQQSCFIPKTAIKMQGIYPKISGKDLKMHESLPESYLDSRLIWKAGKYYLAMPSKTPRVPNGDNQARVVAIDPGIRNFVTFYSDDTCGFIGSGDFSRIQRLACYLDDLISRMTKVSKQRQHKMRIAAARMREKIKHLIDELHHKTALFLVKNFELILLPTFETQAMVSKAGRRIQSKSVRAMLTFAHYRFKQFIKHKAFEYGKRVVDVNEAYTSKTHPETGEVKNIGGAKLIRLLSGAWVNRDLVGARNILLRALVDTPQSADWQLNVFQHC